MRCNKNNLIKNRITHKLLIATIALLLLQTTFIALFTSVTADHGLEVIVPTDYQTIQKAIDASDPGTTIIIKTGTYYVTEYNINKQIHLIGEGNPIINANDSYYGFELNEDGISIANLTFTNSGTEERNAAIRIRSNNNQIINNIFMGNKQHGIYIYDYNNNLIQSNIFDNNLQSGIYLLTSTETVIQNNTFSNNDEGIYLDNAFNNQIIDNVIDGNSPYGIYLVQSNLNLLLNNYIDGNGEGICLFSSQSNDISSNTITNNQNNGISLIDSSDSNTISGNYITDNEVFGIYISNSTNNEISNNYFENTQNAYDNDVNTWEIMKTIAENIINGPYIAGNYWNDFNGTDINFDGLSETPYSINGGLNYDNAALCQQTNYAPYLPASPFPAHQAIDVSRAIDLTWTGGDFDIGDTVRYDVYFGTSQNPPLIAQNYSATTIDPGILNYLTTYYWKINAKDSKGIATEGDLWSFTTKESGTYPGPQEPRFPYDTAPTADAGGPYEWYINVELIFDGSASFDDGTIVSYEWDFGDGNKDKGASPTYNYGTVGNYIVTLTVTDDSGKTATDITYALIVERPNNPPSTPFITTPSIGTQNVEYSFTVVSTDFDNDTIQYIFEWGDETSSTTEFLTNGYETTQQHSWDKAGKYTVTVTAYDNKTETSAETTILIDSYEIPNFGLLLDQSCDGIYDAFSSTSSDEKTKVEPSDTGKYLIDVDGDNVWDYEYNILTNQLESYTEPVGKDSGIIILSYIFTVIIFIVIIIAVVKYLGDERNKNI